MSQRYVTITGNEEYKGSSVFYVGQTLTLIKDLENEQDQEAICVHLQNIGVVGSVVSNSETLVKGTRSGGRIYDCFTDACIAKVRFIVGDTVIAQLDEHSMNYNPEEQYEDELEDDPIKFKLLDSLGDWMEPDDNE